MGRGWRVGGTRCCNVDVSVSFEVPLFFIVSLKRRGWLVLTTMAGPGPEGWGCWCLRYSTGSGFHLVLVWV